jgi:hypothetical protein
MANDKPGKPISKEEFEKLRKKYDQKNPGKTKSVTFSKETFERVMKNPKTENIAVYFGETDDDTNTVMIVGVDAENKLLLDTAEDRGQPCPPYCPAS